MGDAKMTAEDRLRALPGIGPHADLTAPFWRQLPSTVIALMEAHAAAAVAEVEKERDSARSGATLAYGRLLELLDVLRERTDALDRVVKERDEWRNSAEMAQASADSWRVACTDTEVRALKAEARVAELEAEVERVRGLLQRGLDLNIVEANCSGVDDWEDDVTAALAPQEKKEVPRG